MKKERNRKQITDIFKDREMHIIAITRFRFSLSALTDMKGRENGAWLMLRWRGLLQSCRKERWAQGLGRLFGHTGLPSAPRLDISSCHLPWSTRPQRGVLCPHSPPLGAQVLSVLTTWCCVPLCSCNCPLPIGNRTVGDTTKLWLCDMNLHRVFKGQEQYKGNEFLPLNGPPGAIASIPNSVTLQQDYLPWGFQN